MQNKQSLLLRNQIPKNWQKVKFEDLFLEPVRNGVYKKKEFHGRGQKVVNMGELFAFNFISNQDMKRVALNSSELEKNLLWDGDLLFARRSLVLEGSGKCSIVRKPNEETTFESSIIRTRLDKKIAEPLFYYYYFKSPQGRGVMASIASQTAVSGITGNNLSQLNVPVPPKSVQLQIASILSAFDDLIENNNKQTKILEEMAQAIYKEWFVKFRFPGHEKVKMVDSPLGKIPERWQVVKVEDLVERISSGKQYDNKTVKVVGLVPVLDQGKSGIIGYHEDEPGVNANEDNPVIVFANHTCYQRLVHFSFSAIQNVLPFIPKKAKFRNIYWLYYATKGLVKFNDYKGHWPEFMSKKLLLPEDYMCKEFGAIIKPIELLIFKLEKENTNLRETRDLLLPKLMRGEIRI